MTDLRSHVIHKDDLVCLTDVHCGAPMSKERGEEEYASGHHIVFVRAGVFAKHSKGHTVFADAGQVLFFNNHEPFQVSHPAEGGDHCTVVAFSIEPLTDALAVHDPQARDRPLRPFGFSHAPVPPGVLLAHHRLLTNLRLGCGTPLEVAETALALLEAVVAEAYQVRGGAGHATRATTRRRRREWVEETKLLLVEKPGADWSLDTLARAVACSPFHLSRLFRTQVGCPIHQYQLRLRLALALERLAEGATDLSRLALELGFSSHSHFTTTFRRVFNTTPSEVRKQGRRSHMVRKNLEA